MIEDIFVQGGRTAPKRHCRASSWHWRLHSRAPSSTCSPTPARKIRNCLTQFLNSFNGKRVRWFLFSLEIAETRTA
uniref:Uncharacterized protein n=1 Tax=Macrostomum lignano TaxID=282301 RepID=A0A1I8F7K4_9PLAT